MGRFLAKMERKFGKYAIRNLPLFTTIIYAAGYLMTTIWPEVMGLFSLNPYAIFYKGQVWRLFTWILIPDSGSNIFFVLISMYFYYSIGRTLERTWGSFLYNIYYFAGLFWTVVGAIALFGILELFGQGYITQEFAMYAEAFGELPALYGGSWAYYYISTLFGVYYIHMSIFLAFAITYPDMQVNLFFLLPIKVKALGIIYVIIMGYSIVMGFVSGGLFNGIIQLMVIGMSLLNTLIFFLMTRKKHLKSPKEIKRQHDYKVKVRAASNVTKHKCAICGQTEKDNPDLEFRYCSKCEGNYEYCSEHLFTHEHVKRY